VIYLIITVIAVIVLIGLELLKSYRRRKVLMEVRSQIRKIDEKIKELDKKVQDKTGDSI